VRSRPQMQLVGQDQTPDQLPPTPSISTTTTPQPDIDAFKRNALQWRQGLIASLNVAAAILAVRLILLLAVMGAIALAWVALQAHDLLRLAVLAVYTVTCVGPLIWLSSRR
jgi:hypothetical protein